MHEKAYDAFVEQSAARTRALRQGGPTAAHDVDIGSLTTKQLRPVQQHVEDAVNKGATIAAQSQDVGDLEQGARNKAQGIPKTCARARRYVEDQRELGCYLNLESPVSPGPIRY